MVKKGRMIGIIIVILGIGLLVGGFVLSKTDLFNNSNTNNGYTYTKKEKSMKIQSLYDIVANVGLDRCGEYKLFTDKKTTSAVFTNSDIGRMVAYKLFKKDESVDLDITTFTKIEIEEAVKELFGTSITFEHQTVEGYPGLVYDSSKKEYKLKMDESKKCKGASTGSKIYKYTEEKGELVFTVYVVFAKDGKYYSDYAKTNLLYNGSSKMEDVKYNDGSFYKVVFKKENGNYILDYVEPTEKDNTEKFAEEKKEDK